MKISHVSGYDLIGQRFNGHYIAPKFAKNGHECHQLVWEKQGFEEFTHEAFPFPCKEGLSKSLRKLEERVSIRSLAYPFSFGLPLNEHFKNSDVIHYHLVHWPEYFSLLSFPLLTKLKPSVWTIHDPWPLTGHCVYPFDCEKWQTGCGNCPSLTIPFPVKKDRTRLNWMIKKAIYRYSSLDLIVASQHMKRLIEKSPLLRNSPIHHVPFGLDLGRFSPGDTAFAKRVLQIPSGNIVISFRSAPGPLKGLQYIKDALARLETHIPITLLTFQVPGQFDDFRSKYQVIDLGWIDDEEVMITGLRASDLFLMPSEQEAFGMMAIEAMACGKPVITFQGTSLPDVIFAPEGGIAVPMRDSAALLDAIKTLAEDAKARARIGLEARRLAEREYDIDLHVRRLERVYESALARRSQH